MTVRASDRVLIRVLVEFGRGATAACYVGVGNLGLQVLPVPGVGAGSCSRAGVGVGSCWHMSVSTRARVAGIGWSGGG